MITETIPTGNPREQAPAPRAASAPLNDRGVAEKDLLQEGRKLQQLIQQAEQLRDPVARATVHECLHSLLEFYGSGLARLLHVVQASGTAGEHVYARLVEDPSVRGLLLIHGLHPLDLATRLRQAMEKVRPYMESHGGNVELVSLENEVARFRLQGACQTCPSSAITLELALRQAIEQACPDLVRFEVDNVTPPSSK